MGEFANSPVMKFAAWATAAVILALNFWLAFDLTSAWIESAAWHAWVIAPPLAALVGLVGWIVFAPGRPHAAPEVARIETGAEAVAGNLPPAVYRKILVPLDHSAR